MSEYLVGSPAFKAGGTGDPRPAGSIPVHLRQAIRSADNTDRGRCNGHTGRREGPALDGEKVASAGVGGRVAQL